MNKKVSVFIPVFNEEKLIVKAVEEINSILREYSVDYEIFLVDDGSQDQTKMIAKKYEEKKYVTFLHYERGPTRRENLAQSFKKAEGDIIVFVDVDLFESFVFLPELIHQVGKQYDIVVGSRYIAGSIVKRNPLRLLLSILYNRCIRFIFQTNIRDHMCGFKAFKSDVALTLIKDMGYDTTLRRGIFWDTEMFIRARKRGYSIKEIPIHWHGRRESALCFRREIRTLLYILIFMYRQRNVYRKK